MAILPVGQLQQQLLDAGLPIVGVAEEGDGYRIDYDGSETPEQVEQGNAIVVAFVPSTAPDPEWNEFRAALYSNAAWMRVLNANPATASVIVASLFQAAQNPSLLMEVTVLWNGAIEGMETPLSTEEINNLNAIAVSNHIPLRLDESGVMMSL